MIIVAGLVWQKHHGRRKHSIISPIIGAAAEVIPIPSAKLNWHLGVGAADKLGLEGLGPNSTPAAAILLALVGRVGAPGGKEGGHSVETTVRGVDRMVKQILGRHDAVIHQSPG